MKDASINHATDVFIFASFQANRLTGEPMGIQILLVVEAKNKIVFVASVRQNVSRLLN
jgi:hypothetical protein